MIRLILSGANGRMGKIVAQLAADASDFDVVGGYDLTEGRSGAFPICSDFSKLPTGDVLIDFSNPACLTDLLQYGLKQKVPLVLCATGYSPEQLEDIQAAAKEVPIFRSGNMSLGINLLRKLVREAAAKLGEDFDIEIVERHHGKKLDAPSGTALMLAEAAAEGLPHPSEYIYERESRRQERGKQEIGISSIRGGTIVGDHTVIFAGHDEVIELSHHAASREVFAKGALAAARYLPGKAPGLYSMDDVLI